MEADFLDAVEVIFPLEEAGSDFAGGVVINKINRNFFTNFGNHRLKLYLITEINPNRYFIPLPTRTVKTVKMYQSDAKIRVWVR